MPLASYLEFREVVEPIRRAVTKFGGDPCWREDPQWPLHPTTGEPMLFVGQVALDPALFGSGSAEMAYIFVAGPDPRGATVGFERNENAVVLQPGVSIDRPCVNQATGPSVGKLVKGKRRILFRERVLVPAEYEVVGTQREEPQIHWEEDDPYQVSTFDMGRSKIGGQPVWIQGEDPPYGEDSRLFLQLAWSDLPFHLNLGDAGLLYAFLSPDGTNAEIVWQCY